MAMIFYDLDEENMSLSVLKDDFKNVSHYTILSKRIQ
jgi:hypothetical protein